MVTKDPAARPAPGAHARRCGPAFPLARRTRLVVVTLAAALLSLGVPSAATAHASASAVGSAPGTQAASARRDPTPAPSTGPGAGGGGTAASTPAQADDGERAWSIRPATAKGEPDHRTHFTLQGGAGDTVTDYVLISNASKVAATFDVYGTDAFNTSDGAFDLLPTAKAPVDLGAWMTFPTSKLTIPAGASVAMAFKVTVPANASPGDHAGGVVVALSSGSDVRLDTRVATRVYLRVPGFLRPALSVQYVQPSYAGVTNPFGGGGITLSYIVSNTGNIRLQSHPKVTVRSALFGARLAEVTPSDLPELLPGQHVSYRAHLDGVFPAGPLTVTVDLQPFVDPEQPVGQAIGVFSGSATIWAVPWLLLALVVLVIGLSVALAWFLRRRRRGGGARPQATPPSAPRPGKGAPRPGDEVVVGAAAGGSAEESSA